MPTAHRSGWLAARQLAAAAAIAVASLLLLSPWLPAAVRASRDPNEPPNPLPCNCSDVDPRDDFTKVNVPYSCWEQSNFKDVCDQPFMLATPEEVPEGYCQISCGRCKCCATFAEVLQDKAPEFWRLVNLSDIGWKASRPGFEATIIAPADAVVQRMLNSLGYSNHEALARDTGAKAKVNDLVGLHVVPPTPDLHALWTAPFMRDKARLTTLTGKVLEAETSSDGKIKLTGNKTSVWLYATDLPVCKGYLNLYG